jgi:hypothetical protein
VRINPVIFEIYGMIGGFTICFDEHEETPTDVNDSPGPEGPEEGDGHLTRQGGENAKLVRANYSHYCYCVSDCDIGSCCGTCFPPVMPSSAWCVHTGYA